jgi:hypothetical protein
MKNTALGAWSRCILVLSMLAFGLVLLGALHRLSATAQVPGYALVVVEDPPQQLNRIYQRDPGGGYTKSFTVKVVEGGDADVEAQIVRATDGGEEVPWRKVGTSRNGSATFDVRFSDGSHFIRFRKRGEPSSTVQSINRIGVGDNELMIGQSGMRNFSSLIRQPYPVELPLAAGSEIRNLRRFSGHGYFDPTERIRPSVLGPGTNEPIAGPTQHLTGGNGLLEYLRKAQAARGYPVGAYFFPIGGTNLDVWIPGGKGFDAMAAILDAPGGPGWVFTRLHIFGGETNAVRNDSRERTTALYEQIVRAVRTKANKPDLPVHISLLGPLNTRHSTDESSEEVREAQMALPERDPRIQIALNKLDQPLSDNFAHNTPQQHEQQARRWLQNVLSFDRLVANGCQGPRGRDATVARGSDEIVITVQQDGGKTLLDSFANPAGTGLSSFQLQKNGKVLDHVEAYLDHGRVRLKSPGLDAQPDDKLSWRYMYGERPDIGNVVYDDTSPQGDSLGCPMQPSRNWQEISVR